jgi:hypothetical protein
MRVNKYLFLTLAALLGVFALALPAQAVDSCVSSANKFKDGATCLVDLNTKWNELVGKVVQLNVHMLQALGSIESACEAMDSDDDCSPSAFLAVDTALAMEHADDAIGDLENASALLDEINGTGGIIEDFQDELGCDGTTCSATGGFWAKLNGASSTTDPADYPFSDRTMQSAKRTVELIGSLVGRVSSVLDGVAGNVDGTCGGTLALEDALGALQSASDELGAADPDGDVVLFGEDGGVPEADHDSGLEGALFCVQTAILAKDRALKKHLSQVKKSISKLQKLFRVAINKVNAHALSLAQASIYSLSGQLVSVGTNAALLRNSLANGVYVIVYGDGRVEKLVVLH